MYVVIKMFLVKIILLYYYLFLYYSICIVELIYKVIEIY